MLKIIPITTMKQYIKEQLESNHFKYCIMSYPLKEGENYCALMTDFDCGYFGDFEPINHIPQRKGFHKCKLGGK
jgi:hypothetical protein